MNLIFVEPLHATAFFCVCKNLFLSYWRSEIPISFGNKTLRFAQGDKKRVTIADTAPQSPIL